MIRKLLILLSVLSVVFCRFAPIVQEKVSDSQSEADTLAELHLPPKVSPARAVIGQVKGGSERIEQVHVNDEPDDLPSATVSRVGTKHRSPSAFLATAPVRPVVAPAPVYPVVAPAPIRPVVAPAPPVIAVPQRPLHEAQFSSYFNRPVVERTVKQITHTVEAPVQIPFAPQVTRPVQTVQEDIVQVPVQTAQVVHQPLTIHLQHQPEPLNIGGGAVKGGGAVQYHHVQPVQQAVLPAPVQQAVVTAPVQQQTYYQSLSQPQNVEHVNVQSQSYVPEYTQVVQQSEPNVNNYALIDEFRRQAAAIHERPIQLQFKHLIPVEFPSHSPSHVHDGSGKHVSDQSHQLLYTPGIHEVHTLNQAIEPKLIAPPSSVLSDSYVDQVLARYRSTNEISSVPQVSYVQPAPVYQQANLPAQTISVAPAPAPVVVSNPAPRVVPAPQPVVVDNNRFGTKGGRGSGGNGLVGAASFIQKYVEYPPFGPK